MKRMRAWQKRTIGPWVGREWAVYIVNNENDTELIDKNSLGALDQDAGSIAVRLRDRDGMLLTLIHELIHPGAPRLYDPAARPEVQNLAVVIKSGLEAFGVDLSPMLRGYK